jgi:hypothetical protein
MNLHCHNNLESYMERWCLVTAMGRSKEAVMG